MNGCCALCGESSNGHSYGSASDTQESDRTATNRPTIPHPTRKTVRWAPDVGKSARTRQEFAIERVVDSDQGEDGISRYRVRWVGYSPEEDTWEIAQHLPPHFIRQYEKAKRRKLRGALLIEELSRSGIGPYF